MTESPATPTPETRPWQPRFGILGLLLLTLVASVMAAGGNYLVQMLRGGRTNHLAFVLFTITSPLLLLVFVSTLMAVLRKSGRRRRP